ncbi:MAG: hypothetical protein ACE5JR_02550 [Gemmatimonadota bacterium]
MRGTILALAVAGVGCAGASAYLPNEPGSSLVDLSSQSDRERWVAEHPDESEGIRAALLEGVFVSGMSMEHVRVITNPRRAGTTGGGFWRRFETVGETRYRWYVAGAREPFDDARGRPVCELVFVQDILNTVRYCGRREVADTKR